jgi:hypothetical protein
MHELADHDIIVSKAVSAHISLPYCHLNGGVVPVDLNLTVVDWLSISAFNTSRMYLHASICATE